MSGSTEPDWREERRKEIKKSIENIGFYNSPLNIPVTLSRDAVAFEITRLHDQISTLRQLRYLER